MFHKFENCTEQTKCIRMDHRLKALEYRLGIASADLKYGPVSKLSKDDRAIVDRWAMNERLSVEDYKRLGELERIETERVRSTYKVFSH